MSVGRFELGKGISAVPCEDPNKSGSVIDGSFAYSRCEKKLRCEEPLDARPINISLPSRILSQQNWLAFGGRSVMVVPAIYKFNNLS
jgi:hypothetical protein